MLKGYIVMLKCYIVMLKGFRVKLISHWLHLKNYYAKGLLLREKPKINILLPVNKYPVSAVQMETPGTITRKGYDHAKDQFIIVVKGYYYAKGLLQ